MRLKDIVNESEKLTILEQKLEVLSTAQFGDDVIEPGTYDLTNYGYEEGNMFWAELADGRGGIHKSGKVKRLAM